MAKENKKILILRFGALGDIVHSTVIAHAIKEKYPQYEIHYCCEVAYSKVLVNNPDIDKIICYDKRKRGNWLYNCKLALKLRKENYDIVFNLTKALRNFVISILTNPKSIYINFPMRDKHVVEAFFNTAKQAFKDIKLPKRLYLGVDETAKNKVLQEIQNYPKPWIIFSPGGEADNNRQGRVWPKGAWAELGELINKKFNGTIFITGSKAEQNYHKEILDKIPNAILCSGKYTLLESMALISLCNIFISGDSGPLHIASGLDVPTIGIFGSTNPKNVAPYCEKGICVGPKTKCKFCWQKKCRRLKPSAKYTQCMKSVRPKVVLQKIIENNIL